jgi:hypothetical protein
MSRGEERVERLEEVWDGGGGGGLTHERLPLKTIFQGKDKERGEY